VYGGESKSLALLFLAVIILFGSVSFVTQPVVFAQVNPLNFDDGNDGIQNNVDFNSKLTLQRYSQVTLVMKVLVEL